MARSQRVAHYISDSENDIDMEVQPSNNTETVKRTYMSNLKVEFNSSFKCSAGIRRFGTHLLQNAIYHGKKGTSDVLFSNILNILISQLYI